MSVTQGSISQKAVLLPPASESPGESGKGADCWAPCRPTESEALGMASGSLQFLQVPWASLGHVKVWDQKVMAQKPVNEEPRWLTELIL